jgi:DNA mismatch repair protein MutS
VAKLAGIPGNVIDMAKEQLAQLEAGQHAVTPIAAPIPVSAPVSAAPTVQPVTDDPFQSDMFGAAAPHPAVEELEQLSPDDLSPRQALELLYKLKGLV